MAGVPPSKKYWVLRNRLDNNCPPALARSQGTSWSDGKFIILCLVRQSVKTFGLNTGRHKISVTLVLFMIIFQMLLQKICADLARIWRGDWYWGGTRTTWWWWGPSSSTEPEQMGPEFDDSFDLEDADSLRRVTGDMCAATPPVLSVTMVLPGRALACVCVCVVFFVCFVGLVVSFFLWGNLFSITGSLQLLTDQVSH